MEEKNTKNELKIKKATKVSVFAETICEDTMELDENDRINEELGLEDEAEEIISEQEQSMRLRQQLTTAGLIRFFGNKIQSFSRDNEGAIVIKFNNFNKKNK